VSLVVLGTAERAQLTRDEKGSFHPVRTDAGAFFAAGFAHAQDRIVADGSSATPCAGRLSELLGRGRSRKMRGCERWGYTLRPSSSCWRSANQRKRPWRVTGWRQRMLVAHPVLQPEFLLLGVKPEPWTPVDSLACGKLFALQLAETSWRSSLTRQRASISIRPNGGSAGDEFRRGSPLRGRLERDELSRWLR